MLRGTWEVTMQNSHWAVVVARLFPAIILVGCSGTSNTATSAVGGTAGAPNNDTTGGTITVEAVAGATAAGGTDNSGGALSTGGTSGSNGGTLSMGGNMVTTTGGVQPMGGTSGSNGGTLSMGGNMVTTTGGVQPMGGTSGTGGAAVAGATSGTSCPGNGGPTMVRLPEGYCIDSTEVTRQQYEKWLATKPSTTGQVSVCTWNQYYEPWKSCMSLSTVCQTNCDNYPQVCINWCDAYAFCAAVGKRLCGAIGAGSVGYNDESDAGLSQWYNACSAGGQYAYPYGNTYEANRCNHYTSSLSSAAPCGFLENCVSMAPGYEGIYDMSGNVWEWEDSCDGTEASDSCHVRGGGITLVYETRMDLRCDWPSFQYRNQANGSIGFRCCAP
jgi:formylglycine-generating enzyme